MVLFWNTISDDSGHRREFLDALGLWMARRFDGYFALFISVGSLTLYWPQEDTGDLILKLRYCDSYEIRMRSSRDKYSRENRSHRWPNEKGATRHRCCTFFSGRACRCSLRALHLSLSLSRRGRSFPTHVASSPPERVRRVSKSMEQLRSVESLLCFWIEPIIWAISIYRLLTSQD